MLRFPFLSSKKHQAAESAGSSGGSGGSGRRGRKTQKDGGDTVLLNEKKRARRRLVGAVALMLGLVIALPMIMDAEPKSALDDIDIRIPSKEKTMRSSTPGPVYTAVKQRELKPPKSVVVKQAKSTAKAKAAPAKAGSKVVIQVAALSSQKKVDELRAQLKRSKIKSYTEKVSNKKGAPIRVRIGPFTKRSAAESTCAKLLMMELRCTIMPI